MSGPPEKSSASASASASALVGGGQSDHSPLRGIDLTDASIEVLDQVTIIFCNTSSYSDCKLHIKNILDLRKSLENLDEIKDMPEDIRDFLCLDKDSKVNLLSDKKDIIKARLPKHFYRDVVFYEEFLNHPFLKYFRNVGFEKVMCMIVDSPVEEVQRNINKYGELFAKNIK